MRDRVARSGRRRGARRATARPTAPPRAARPPGPEVWALPWPWADQLPKLLGDRAAWAQGCRRVRHGTPCVCGNSRGRAGYRGSRGGTAHGGGGRRAQALPLQPRQGLLSRDGLHQGPGDRVLHAHRARAAAAPARPPPHPQALSRRRPGPVLLREAVPVAPARLGRDGAGVVAPQRAQHHLLPRGGPRHAGLAGQPGRPRAAYAARARHRAQGADHARLRPRSGAARDRGAVRGGRLPAARRVRPLRPAGLPEDVGLQGDAALRAAQHAAHATSRPRPSRCTSPRCSSGATRASSCPR